MRERGVESVTIQDITEAADVGHGTFYLYFDTKAEVLRPVIERLAARIHAEVDRATEGTSDPARRLSAGVRIALRAIARDPLWMWFVFHDEVPFERLSLGLGQPPADDIANGVRSGRFRISDLEATRSFLDGGLLGVLNARRAGRCSEEAIDDTADLFLRSLGVPAEEAARIAHLRLPQAALTSGDPRAGAQIPGKKSGREEPKASMENETHPEGRIE